MVKMRRRRIFSKDVTEKTWQFFEKLTLISQKVNKIWCLYGQFVRGIIGIMPAFWALSRASEHGILGMTQKHNREKVTAANKATHSRTRRSAAHTGGDREYTSTGVLLQKLRLAGGHRARAFKGGVLNQRRCTVRPGKKATNSADLYFFLGAAVVRRPAMRAGRRGGRRGV
jgi:hypothetical protein